MKIYMAADHGGFTLKQQLVGYLQSHGYEVQDLGAHELLPDDDYPDYAQAVGQAVTADPGSCGIAICRNGQGICLAANKVVGVRAVSAWSPEQAAATRKDDDANVLCLAADYQSGDEATAIVDRWLSINASADERHVRRRQKVAALDVLR